MARTFELETFLPFRLNMLAQEASERLAAIYGGRFGLDIPQWRVLANLAARGAMTANGIAAVTRSHKSTISRAVASLERRKLVRRAADAGDRRAFVLRLTGKGEALFKELLPLVLGFERELMSKLSAAERGALLEGLDGLERVFHGVREDAR